ncbi:glutamyl-tRNA amidotransferase subunit A [Delitschia confertaspora ATCC 74209]|uniref:Glutamyl-tRNA(Gln) amidotransferase subunit A, mitochondrial n=1 Tax=Delitschia confertaspora ATCC 74209 TaxID=1513339 RepID=A0A9P4JS55_9PLEO|nr:glutamyl-tRNA amidotransferase subunit A [Delitschia confertaspora ATCC 74209]
MSVLREAQRCVANHVSCSSLNAFVRLADSSAILSQAQNAASTTGPLAGKLIAIKDNICTFDLPTTASSRILKSYKSPYDATVVKQLREAAAIIVGKTNMDEFGMGSHSTHSHFGAVKQKRVNGEESSAGGSSGGSAVAVASDQCWAALGTDTGGSVRLPAAYTGTVGFKPSYGLLSRWGVIDYANSLDTVGILARNVQDAQIVFDTLNKYDPQDPTSLLPSTRSRLRSSKPRSRPLRIGIPVEYNITSLHPHIRSTWLSTLHYLQETHGAILQPISLPSTRHALSAYYILAPAEASSNLAKYDGVRYGTRAPSPDGTPESVLFAKTRGQNFGKEVKRRILLGAFSLSAKAMDNYFIQAQKIRRLVQKDFDAVFKRSNPLLEESFSAVSSDSPNVDVIICPTAPTPPPTLESLSNQDPLDAYMNDVFTVPASLAGLPALSVPIEREAKGVGMQVLGQFGDDSTVLDVSEMLEGMK